MKVLVLQFREDASLEHERVCLQQLSSTNAEVDFTFLNLLEKTTILPTPQELPTEYDRLILGGSGELYVVSDPDKPDLRVAALKKNFYPWLKEVLALDFPTLGTCFGFQLILDCLGYPLTNELAYRETGILPITLTLAGKNSELFKKIDSPFFAVLGHRDSLPPGKYLGIEVLATSERCIQAFRYRRNIYGTQFHSELDEEGLAVRLAMYPSYGETNAGQKMNIQPCKQAVRVTRNFLRPNFIQNTSIS